MILCSTILQTVPNGDYNIVLHFAEVYQKALGKRSFDAVVEGDLVIDGLDIFAVVENFTALAMPIPASVDDGYLTIEFVRDIENPKVNAIAIHSAAFAAPVAHGAPVAAPVAESVSLDSDMPSSVPSTIPSAAPSSYPSMVPSSAVGNSMQPSITSLGSDMPYSAGDSAMPSMIPSSSTYPSMQPSFMPSSPQVAFEPIRINVGGGEIVDSSTGNLWQADNYYNTGLTASIKPTQAISGTTFDELYRRERYDEAAYPNLLYSIPGESAIEYHVSIFCC